MAGHSPGVMNGWVPWGSDFGTAARDSARRLSARKSAAADQRLPGRARVRASPSLRSTSARDAALLTSENFLTVLVRQDSFSKGFYPALHFHVFTQGMFIYKYGLLSNMPRSIQTGSSISRKSRHIRSATKPKRIADVVGLRILADEDWKETRAELKKINKDTLDRLEKSY